MVEKNFDVIIVGAGLSGIGAAYHLQKACPRKNYAILEARESIGGTWDLFRYPGIRSDSDMHTLGYHFKPWREAKSIADGPSILHYINETAKENNIDEHIIYSSKVISANWSSKESQWKVSVFDTAQKKSVDYVCNFLQFSSGYYNYDAGYTPAYTELENFRGDFIHPQKWPEGLDYANKKIVVIGSGATAVTLVPSLAKTAQHVTMLQRTPTYVVSRPDKDAVANFLRKFLPEKLAYKITRWKNIAFQQFFYRRARKNPEKVKQMILSGIRQELGSGYDVEKDFTPDYKPWDQRLCLVPNADLFKSIRSGKANIVTNKILRFVKNGVELQSGEVLDADIVVSATGLDMVMMGGANIFVDDEPVDFSKVFTYKGMMFSGVPNLMSTFGYINASWTLRADLNSQYLCRLLEYMEKHKFQTCTPELRENEKEMVSRPWIDDFSPGYFQRILDVLPKQGSHEPWLNTQNYSADKKLLQKGRIDDGVMGFK
ncbi:MAG: NAD(P)/FAD-dependent oxidoreductase [Cellvibrionaceae bacterium]